MTRYMLIDKEMGVFLGTYTRYVLFAENDFFEITKVYTFESEEKAQAFVNKNLDTTKLDYFIAPIKSKEQYVSVIDVIKAGYGDYTSTLMNNLQMISNSAH